MEEAFLVGIGEDDQSYVKAPQGNGDQGREGEEGRERKGREGNKSME
jgi:hypothetical protein